jgi:hypothetical protein
MPSTSLELTRTYTSFSGVDIKAVGPGGNIIGTLQAISYAVQREKAPIYVMGRVDPLSFSRGKRGIAGTMISLMLDQHIIFNDAFREEYFLADVDEIYPNIGSPESLTFSSAADDNRLDELTQTQPTATALTSLEEGFEVTSPWYVDQIRPFDVVVVAANEYGNAAQMRIYGIEILNEGSGFSIDDIVIENQMTYVARTILPWQKLGSWDMSTPGSSGFTAAS